jgi:hypothetical protein
MATPRHTSDKGRSPEKKVVPFNVRVAATEKAAFVRAAEIAGIPISVWVRERLRAAALRELDNIGEPVPFLKPNNPGGSDD